MPEITHIIRARTVEKLRKEARTLKKSLKIPHHEALDLAARKFDFNNWEHLQKSAAATAISEEPYRNGLVIAMDIKDATEHPPAAASQIVEDHQVYGLIYMDFFTQRGYKSEEDLTEDDRYFLEDLEINYIYFRYEGKTPNSAEEAFEIAENEFFFAPEYIWLKGKWYNRFGVFDYDELIEEISDDNLF